MYGFVADQVFGIGGLINLSNIVFLVAYSVRDVLKLRILAIVGEGPTLPYYYFQDENRPVLLRNELSRLRWQCRPILTASLTY